MATIPRNKLAQMSLQELYQVPKMTPSVTKRILMLEDFSQVSDDYCRTHCHLPVEERCNDKVRLQRARADVLIVFPKMSSDTKLKFGDRYKDVYGWSEDNNHKKIINYLVEEYLQGLTVTSTYALKCRPSSKTKITTTALKKCTPYLHQEIAAIGPRIVICVGKETSQALGIAKPERGRITPLEGPGGVIPVVTTIHPRTTLMIRQNSSGSFWGPDYLTILEHDFRKAGELARGEFQYEPKEQAIERFRQEKMRITTTIEEVRQLRDDILSLPGQRPILAWDTETTSLDPWSEDARMLCIQFCFKHPQLGVISVVVPLFHRENTYYDPWEAWVLIVEILTSPNTIKIGHNLAFDIVFTRVVYGIEHVNCDFDTMLLLHSLNSGLQGFYDLKTATADHLYWLNLTGYEDDLDLKALAKALNREKELADEALENSDEIPLVDEEVPF